MSDIIKEELQHHLLNVKNILNEINERVEGNLICDITADNLIIDKTKSKVYNIQKLAKLKSKICEIGVNAGHSLLLMIYNNPNAEYVIFDLNNHSYTKPCIDYIKSVFPSTKITEVYGDTKITLPQWIKENKNELNTFDLIHIDGGHDTHTVVNDFIYTTQLLSRDGVAIFDDYNYDNIKNVIDYYENKSLIKEYLNDLEKTNQHFIYKIND